MHRSIAIALVSLTAGLLAAQQDVPHAPAPPLQFPTAASSTPARRLGLDVVRSALEEAGNVSLCKHFMKQSNPNVVFPEGFTFANCEASAAAKVRNGQGDLRWADGARPTQCKLDCVGRPSMDQTRALDAPNRRLATVRGRITFTAVNVGPTPFDRNVISNLQVNVDCRTEGGSRTGVLRINAAVDQPFVDDSGFFEGLADFFLGPLNLSRSIEDGIRAAVRGSGGSTAAQELGPCSSIGVDRGPVEHAASDDAFVWDVAAPRPIVAPVAAPFGSTATVFIDSITRKPTLDKSPPTDPLQFTLFVNGSLGIIPRIGTIALPPSGGTHAQSYCKTVSVNGLNNLQILFVDNIGGSVWSQFPKSADYGNGPSRVMTTGRQFFQVPNRIPGVPTPPGGDKPQAVIAREFEVRYRIVFQPPVIAPVPSSGTRGGVGGTHVGTSGGGVIGPVEPPRPCTRI